MSDINLVEDFDYAITSVRDTDWHWIDDGEDARVGVDYNDIECVVNECAEKWQLSHDKLTEQNKMLREALESIRGRYEVTDFDIDTVIREALEATK